MLLTAPSSAPLVHIPQPSWRLDGEPREGKGEGRATLSTPKTPLRRAPYHLSEKLADCMSGCAKYAPIVSSVTARYGMRANSFQ
jgi:hypothetical protein